MISFLSPALNGLPLSTVSVWHENRTFKNKTQIWDDKDSIKANKNNKGFDDDFRERWA